MNSAHDEDRFLSIGEAARVWRVSPDSLRAWARQGKLHPVPTPGGQRRFRERELVAVMGNPHTASRADAPGKREPRRRAVGIASLARLDVDRASGSPEVYEAREQLAITRARRDTQVLRHEMEQGRIETAKREEADRVHRENEERLEGLRAVGRSYSAGLPIEWRQRVITLLEGYVTATNIPRSLPDGEAKALVVARVEQVREQHDAQRRRELSDAVDRMRVQRLIQGGRDAAAALTAGWDSRDAEDAQADVARELAQCVEADWSNADVRRSVEEILDEWEEEDDEDDLDDQDDVDGEGSEGEEETW